ncbi:ABC transporter permease [Pseudomonas sp. UBA2684]|uniref:ABC transporter permease n=1 Tax=Pseudomonas sp. UBA2684 TaxID=1947311 RepID=UPI000E97F821|nr:ABC transporter permease [Pseudomonas sp. UBA2684]HBX54667.1 peptide ABC transporter permease [Pseudomonas sp.]|tara:strand:- start:17567 stop:18763 length:1197 start_codon:yes stop_codon:yes gene_type:complete
MQLRDGLGLTASALLSRPLRSLLTLLGVAIGIAAVALLTAIGEGMRGYVQENFAQFGTRNISVRPGMTRTAGLGGLLSSVKPLTIADADALRQLPHVEVVVPMIQGNGDVQFGARSRNTGVLGAGHQMAQAWRFKLALGQFLPTPRDGRSPPYVVLGHTLRQELFGDANPLGELVRVGGMRFRVIGVMEKKGQLLGFDIDDIAYIPVDWAENLFNRTGLAKINVVFGSGTSGLALSEAIRQLLIERHGEEDFSFTTQDDMLRSLDRIFASLTLAVAALGSISLLVGAVGILAIMTTAVAERTAEIGLLRAIGATPQQVLGLFLGEALLLSVLGGLLGLLLMGLLLGALHLSLPGLPLSLRPLFLLLALLLAALVGILAGIAPARRAARLQPVEALHSD